MKWLVLTKLGGCVEFEVHSLINHTSTILENDHETTQGTRNNGAKLVK